VRARPLKPFGGNGSSPYELESRIRPFLAVDDHLASLAHRGGTGSAGSARLRVVD